MKDLSFKLWILILLSSTLFMSCQAKTDSGEQEEVITIDQEKEKQAIIGVLKQQEHDWNTGNIESFMQSYWKSKDLRFVGGSGVSNGWQATLERYQRTYPDQIAMGKLRFEVLSINSITQDVYLLIGKFFLTREIGDLEGIFSLVWKKENDQWVIAADHTTQTNKPS